VGFLKFECIDIVIIVNVSY